MSPKVSAKRLEVIILLQREEGDRPASWVSGRAEILGYKSVPSVSVLWTKFCEKKCAADVLLSAPRNGQRMETQQNQRVVKRKRIQRSDVLMTHGHH